MVWQAVGAPPGLYSTTQRNVVLCVVQWSRIGANGVTGEAPAHQAPCRSTRGITPSLVSNLLAVYTLQQMGDMGGVRWEAEYYYVAGKREVLLRSKREDEVLLRSRHGGSTTT